MRSVLNERMRKAEKLNDNLVNSIAEFQESLELFQDLPGYSGITLGEIPVIDISEYQRGLMREYEDNPVLDDAIQGRISVEDSLSELGKVNRPVWRLLPRRRNKAHNQRLDQIGELIGYSHHLRRNGILIPDNFVGGVAMVAACAYGVSNLLVPYLMGGTNPNADPAEIQHSMEVMRTAMPALMTLMAGPIVGLGVQLQRSGSLPTNEAKYLDGKVQEFYK